jgi:hypothetical protein
MRTKIKDDPAIAQIREIRHQISAEFDHDPDKVLAYYAEFEEKLLHERGIHPDQKRRATS